ncbi:MAG: hypothetical protein WB586_30020 [Chthoniobacterales bacterium]
MTSGSPQDTNTLGDPERVVPVTKRADGLGDSFDYSFAPNSVAVLQIDVGCEHPEPPDETGNDGG